MTNGVRYEYSSRVASRDPFQAPPVASRRGGPVKQPLSREAIVAEALRQVRSDGVAGMSLRKIATSLDTGPASLYAYIDDLNELRALVLDRALADVTAGTDLAGSGGGGTWRDRLGDLLWSYVSVLSSSPGLAQLAFGTIAVGPNAMRIVDAILALLDEGGIEPATAAWTVDLLSLYVTAIAAEQAGGMVDPAPDGPVAQAIARATETNYPHIHAVRDHLLAGSPQQRFTWALDVFILGIVHRRDV